MLFVYPTGNCRRFPNTLPEAMSQAVYPDSSKIYTNLVAINPKNPDLVWKTFNGEPHVLMVTWKSASYYPNGGDSLYNTGARSG